MSKTSVKNKYKEIYDKQAEQVNKTYDASIKEIETAYDDQQRTNAVQKLINERKVAESMANLGLTDSGLNRTQQTAVQLSAANAAYKLNRQKQADIDAYKLKRDSDLSAIEQNRIATEAEIDEQYDSMSASVSAARAQAAANAQNTKIISRNNGVLSRNYTGSLASNGIDVTYNKDEYGDLISTTYVDRNTGYKSTFNYDTNPYTNTVNKDTKYGAFKNGYQPNNIQGLKLQKKDTIYNELTGKEQNIYFCTGREGNKKNGKIVRDKNGKSIAGYYIWWPTLNRYVKVETTTYINNGVRQTYWDVVDPELVGSEFSIRMGGTV